MFIVGTALHLAGSGRLILRSITDVRPGAVLYDEKGRPIAKVAELFGPVKDPYISAVPMTDRITRILHRKVYASPRGEKFGKTRGRRHKL
jgi:rRNA processing protein Gar1